MVQTPTVVRWYKVYAAFMAALYVLVVLGILALWAFEAKWILDSEIPSIAWLAYLLFFLLLSLALAAAFLAVFFLAPKPWVWVYHLILICLGLSSPCLLPACVPLLIFWLKPETRAYYGRANV